MYCMGKGKDWPFWERVKGVRARWGMDEVGSLRGCVQTFTIGRSVVRVLGGKRCG